MVYINDNLCVLKDSTSKRNCHLLNQCMFVKQNTVIFSKPFLDLLKMNPTLAKRVG